jgi:hypothetical protein
MSDIGAEESGHDRLVGARAPNPSWKSSTSMVSPAVVHAGGVGDEVDHRAAHGGVRRLVSHGDNGG